MSTPFPPSKRDLISDAEKLHISKEISIILEDMRFSMSEIMKPVDLGEVDPDPTEQGEREIISTSTWILDQISSLPNGNEADAQFTDDFI